MLQGLTRFDVLAGNWLYACDYGDYERLTRLQKLGYQHNTVVSNLHQLTNGAKKVYTRLEIRWNRESLLANGDLWECPSCLGLGAYCWLYEDDGTGLSAGIRTIGCHSGMGEVTCPHCDGRFVKRDSMLLAEYFTHEHYEELDTADVS